MLGTQTEIVVLTLLYWQSSFRCEIITYHVISMSLSIARKLVGRRALQLNLLSQVPPSLFSRRVFLKGTFVEMYIDIRSRQFLVCVCRMWWTSVSRLTNLWWLAFDECATNYSYNEWFAGILNSLVSTLRKSIFLLHNMIYSSWILFALINNQLCNSMFLWCVFSRESHQKD